MQPNLVVASRPWLTTVPVLTSLISARFDAPAGRWAWRLAGNCVDGTSSAVPSIGREVKSSPTLRIEPREFRISEGL